MIESSATYRAFLTLLIAPCCVGQTGATREPARQEPPRFAVSSIKPSRPDAEMRDMRIVVSGPNLRAVNCTLNELLVNTLQLFWRSEGGPDWVRERRFDISANSEDGASPDLLTQMVFQLLRDRFKLAWHVESKDERGWALTIGKKRPDLLPAKDGEQRRVSWGASAAFQKIGMAEFASSLAGPLNMPVVDRTDLKGEFDFNLRLDEYQPPAGDASFSDRLINSVEGLGFKLVEEKVPVKRVKIDHAELPDDN